MYATFASRAFLNIKSISYQILGKSEDHPRCLFYVQDSLAPSLENESLVHVLNVSNTLAAIAFQFRSS